MTTCLRSGLLLGLAVASAAANADLPSIPDTQGCQHLADRPSLQANESLSWSGTCADGLADGTGTEQWYLDGKLVARYSGTMKQGRYEGAGSRRWANGDNYEGTFVGGKMSGHGLFRWASGNTYEGDFVDGVKTGHGIFQWPDSIYEGDVLNGQRAGHGVMHWFNGDGYEGDFSADEIVGHGVYRWLNGSRYEGSLAAGKPEGHGVLRLANGDQFEGEFANGERLGPFTVQHADGTRGTVTFAPLSQADMVCTKMGRPQTPNTGRWTGTARFRATGTVHGGRVTAVNVQALNAPTEPAIEQLFVHSITNAMMNSYECPGDHVFMQTFVFQVR